MGLPCSSDGKESACNAGDLGPVPGSRRSLRKGNGYPLQYSYLENSVDRGAWWDIVHGFAELDTTEWLPISLSFQLLSGSTHISLLQETHHLLRPIPFQTIDRSAIASIHSMNIYKLAISSVTVKDTQAWHAAVHGVSKSRIQLSNWTELYWSEYWASYVDQW